MAIDIIFLILVIFAFYKGLTKGFVHSLFSFIAIFLGIIGALKFSHLAAVYLQQWFQITSIYVPFLSFLVVFIIILLLIKLIGKLIEKFLEFAQLGLINKISGVLLWTFIVTFIFSTLLWLTNQVNLLSPQLKTSSKCYSYLQNVAPWIIESMGKIFPVIKDSFFQLQNFFDQYSK